MYFFYILYFVLQTYFSQKYLFFLKVLILRQYQAKDIDLCEGVLLISPTRQTAPFCRCLLYSFPTATYKHEIAFYTQTQPTLNN